MNATLNTTESGTGHGNNDVWQLRDRSGTSVLGTVPRDTDFRCARSEGLDECNLATRNYEPSSLPRSLPQASASSEKELENLAARGHRSTVGSHSFHTLRCDVLLLDGQHLVFHIDKNSLGLHLFSLVTTHMMLEQTEYFGLVYYRVDENLSENFYAPDPSLSRDSLTHYIKSGVSTIASGKSIIELSRYLTVRTFNDVSKQSSFIGDVPFWLKMNRRIVDQYKSSGSLTFHFQVKFYPPNPEYSIDDPKTRYQLCLQLRQHLVTGRLNCSFFTHVLLGGLISQMVLGDAHPRHSMCLDERDSVISTQSSRSVRIINWQTLSETRSMLSGRTCSLATPESTDIDEVESEIWSPREEPQECFDQMRVRYSSSVRSDPVPTRQTYLNILPHLNRRSQSVSQQRINFANGDINTTTTTTDAVSSGLQHCWTNLNWPYPAPSALHSLATLKHISQFHRKLHGWSYAKAEHHFLQCVKLLSLYGVELHAIKAFDTYFPHTHGLQSFRLISRTKHVARPSEDPQSHNKLSWRHTLSGCDNRSSPPSFEGGIRHGLASSTFAYSVGVCSLGIVLYWGQVRLSLFRWAQIAEISTRHVFCRVVVKQNTEKSAKKARLMVYKFEFTSPKLSVRFHRSCVDQHRFFRLNIRTARTSHTPPAAPSSEPPSLFEPLSSEERPSSFGAESTPVMREHRHSPSGRLPIKRRGSSWLFCWRRDKLEQSPARPASAQSTSRDTAATIPRCVPVSCSPYPDSPSPWIRAYSTSIPGNSPQSDPAVANRSNGSAPRGPADPLKPPCSLGQQTVLLSHSSRPNHIYPDLVPILTVNRAVVIERRNSCRRSITLTRESVVSSPSERCEPRRCSSALSRPPPRPRMPPVRRSTLGQGVLDSRRSENEPPPPPPSVLAVKKTNCRLGTRQVPLVHTHTSVFTPTGQLVRLPSQSPTTSQHSNDAPNSSPWQLQVPNSVPIVPTRSIRYPTNIRVNEYNIVDSAVIRRISGSNVPRIPTKCLFMHYRHQQPFNQPII
ncbi:hypothetical protein CSKR_102020 [Clonorchis sinensis]|uniref:FERM domain-containing protein n=1 Tax=Clonorchis sinensis TaxID=79923 RepID=A0A8T1MY24_CLOSI|nr:hypothetical protein CSKR_102020 [Clonorchis sinensis]